MFCYRFLNEDGSIDGERLYNKRLYDCVPGTIFSAEVTKKEESRTVTINTSCYEGYHKDRNEVALWAAKDRAVSVLQAANRKAKSNTQIDDAVSTLRNTYIRLNYRERRAFMASVMMDIFDCN